MTSPSTQQILALDEEGFGLGLVFLEHSGRFAHAVLAVTPERRWVILESTEYDSAGEVLTHWPPSPPLQQLSIEPRPDKEQVALMVGMAGKSHWSMSAETDRRRRRIVLDVACRLTQSPQWLGSTYQVIGAPVLTPHAWSPPPSAPQFGGLRSVSLIVQAEILQGAAEQAGDAWRVAPEPCPPPCPPPAPGSSRFSSSCSDSGIVVVALAPRGVNTHAASKPRRGLSPLGDAPRPVNIAIWRGAAPRWDKPSGGGNGHGQSCFASCQL